MRRIHPTRWAARFPTYWCLVNPGHASRGALLELHRALALAATVRALWPAQGLVREWVRQAALRLSTAQRWVVALSSNFDHCQANP